MTASNDTGAGEPGIWRKAGMDSTAQASDAQEDRMARFSSGARYGLLTILADMLSVH